jgi:tetratricopeptide (TPR) repeat protein
MESDPWNLKEQLKGLDPEEKRKLIEAKRAEVQSSLFGPGVDGEEEDWEFKPSDKPAWTDAEIDAHPLFATQLPEDGFASNAGFAALQHVMTDGETPETLADAHKRNGNEAMKHGVKGYKNALEHYTAGLELGCSDVKLNAVLHSNRAQVALSMKEYPKALNDATEAVTLDPEHLKSYWRGATAAIELELWKVAGRFCSRGLLVKPDDAALSKLQAKVNPHIERIAASSKKAQRAARATATQLEVALQSRDVELGPKLYDGMYNGKVEFRDGGLWYPILFLYDEVMQSDFVASASEKSCLEDHFSIMFPDGRNAEWDERGIYKNGRLVAFLEVLADAPVPKKKVPEWEKPDPDEEHPTKMLPLSVSLASKQSATCLF